MGDAKTAAMAPGAPHGREAHKDHVHMQIGVTGTTATYAP